MLQTDPNSKPCGFLGRMGADARFSAGIMRYYVVRYPFRALLAVGCLLCSGLAEGLGITLFLPLVEMISGTAADGGAIGGMGAWVNPLLQRLGLPASLGSLLILMTGLIGIKAVLLWLALNQVGVTIARVAMDLRLDLIRALLRVRWDYFVHKPVGQFSNAISSEAVKASNCFLLGAEILASAILFCVYLALTFHLAATTALAGLGAGCLYMLMMRGLVGRARAAGREQVQLLRSVTGRMVDLLHGIKPLKAMAREDALVGYVEDEMRSLNSAKRREVRASVTLNTAQEPMMVAIMAVGLYVIVGRGLMDFPSLLVQGLLFSRLFAQMGKIVQAYQKLVISESAFQSIRSRVDELLTSREDNRGNAEPPALAKGITLQDVSFAYGAHAVLHRVSLTVPAHEWTALLGPSGSGKTTLSDLVAGLHTPTDGCILVDGAPLRGMDMAKWRRRIGYVPQELLLLHASIFDNVALGEPGISREDVERSLQQSGAWSFVEQLSDGLDTVVGERGARLSGGQRQRIALARALVHRPDLLILDEASASLDQETEEALCRTLRDLCRTTTILSVSHQPAFARAADHVYRVEDGAVRPASLQDAGKTTL